MQRLEPVWATPEKSTVLYQGDAMRFAYADPPYIGQAQKHYGMDEVNHLELINRLVQEYPDGWALSCSSPSLHQLLPICPSDTRVMAWVKPFASFKPNVFIAFAWEPVLVRGGRPRTRQQPTIRDWVSANITLQRGLVGAKPKDFCFWLFEVFNLQTGDEFDDLFPGTGAVTDALATWKARLRQMPLVGP